MWWDRGILPKVYVSPSQHTVMIWVDSVLVVATGYECRSSFAYTVSPEHIAHKMPIREQEPNGRSLSLCAIDPKRSLSRINETLID